MKRTRVVSVLLIILAVSCIIVPIMTTEAKDNDNTQAESLIHGDVDGDGVVTILDATYIQRKLASIPISFEFNDEIADADEDGDVTILDATMIQRYLASLSYDGRIGEPLERPTEPPTTLPTEKQYTVVFKDANGKVISTQTVSSGDSAMPPEAPAKDGYVFKRWDKSFDYVTENVTITPVYEKLSNNPTFVVQNVTAKSGDQSVAVNVYVVNNPGIAAIALDVSYDKSKLTLTNFTYNTNALNGARLLMVNGSANIEGDFTFATLYFDVSDKATGTCPISVTYEEDNVYNIGEQNVSFDIVNGSIIVSGKTATETPDDDTFTVTFKDYDGTELSTQKVKKGESAQAPPNPSREGYVFSRWDKVFDNVQSDISITAIYDKVSTSPSFIIEKVNATPGAKNVAVTIAVKNNPGIAAIALDVSYDKSKLTLTNFTYNTNALNGAGICITIVNGKWFCKY